MRSETLKQILNRISTGTGNIRFGDMFFKAIERIGLTESDIEDLQEAVDVVENAIEEKEPITFTSTMTLEEIQPVITTVGEGNTFIFTAGTYDLGTDIQLVFPNHSTIIGNGAVLTITKTSETITDDYLFGDGCTVSDIKLSITMDGVTSCGDVVCGDRCKLTRVIADCYNGISVGDYCEYISCIADNFYGFKGNCSIYTNCSANAVATVFGFRGNGNTYIGCSSSAMHGFSFLETDKYYPDTTTAFKNVNTGTLFVGEMEVVI